MKVTLHIIEGQLYDCGKKFILNIETEDLWSVKTPRNNYTNKNYTHEYAFECETIDKVMALKVGVGFLTIVISISIAGIIHKCKRKKIFCFRRLRDKFSITCSDFLSSETDNIVEVENSLKLLFIFLGNYHHSLKVIFLQ